MYVENPNETATQAKIQDQTYNLQGMLIGANKNRQKKSKKCPKTHVNLAHIAYTRLHTLAAINHNKRSLECTSDLHKVGLPSRLFFILRFCLGI